MVFAPDHAKCFCRIQAVFRQIVHKHSHNFLDLLGSFFLVILQLTEVLIQLIEPNYIV